MFSRPQLDLPAGVVVVAVSTTGVTCRLDDVAKDVVERDVVGRSGDGDACRESRPIPIFECDLKKMIKSCFTILATSACALSSELHPYFLTHMTEGDPTPHGRFHRILEVRRHPPAPHSLLEGGIAPEGNGGVESHEERNQPVIKSNIFYKIVIVVIYIHFLTSK